jgi:HK97 family phage portal protein
MGLVSWWRERSGSTKVAEAAAAPVQTVHPPRRGYEYGIGPDGLNEWNQSMGAATNTDRRTLMQQLYEAYLACTWAWACVQAIARTITAGGLVVDVDAEDGEDQGDKPEKPPAVLALEQLLRWCNPREDIRQLMRGVITDLEVFGDAFLEVSWLGGVPVALYSLDAPSMFPIADEHGTITGYKQVTELGQRADFDPHEVIHISLDSPRSGIFGVSPTQAAELPITAWLFAAATLKETFRKGNPANVHVDHPQSMAEPEIGKWVSQYMQRNVGPKNIGRPITTKGGASVTELQQAKIDEYLATLDQKRDEIVATYGVPPAEVGIIESGNLGGGTGESQRKTFKSNTCNPLAELVLEKINYAILQQGFGITGWRLRFPDVDLRDSKVIEEVREKRIQTGQYTINRARAEIGEPPIEGGDIAMVLDKTGAVAVRDLPAFSAATVATKVRGTNLEIEDLGDDTTPLTLAITEPEPVPDELTGFAGQNNQPGDPQDAGLVDEPDDEKDDEVPADISGGKRAKSKPRQAREDHRAAYRRRLQEALAEFTPAA